MVLALVIGTAAGLLLYISLAAADVNIVLALATAILVGGGIGGGIVGD